MNEYFIRYRTSARGGMEEQGLLVEADNAKGAIADVYYHVEGLGKSVKEILSISKL